MSAKGQRAANQKHDEACPFSPDCEKCPLADCKVEQPHRFNKSQFYTVEDFEGENQNGKKSGKQEQKP